MFSVLAKQIITLCISINLSFFETVFVHPAALFVQTDVIFLFTISTTISLLSETQLDFTAAVVSFSLAAKMALKF